VAPAIMMALTIERVAAEARQNGARHVCGRSDRGSLLQNVTGVALSISDGMEISGWPRPPRRRFRDSGLAAQHSFCEVCSGRSACGYRADPWKCPHPAACVSFAVRCAPVQSENVTSARRDNSDVATQANPLDQIRAF